MKSSGIFTQLLRRVRAGADTSFNYFCEHCRKETVWWLVAEDATHEYYRCLECRAENGWKVR